MRLDGRGGGGPEPVGGRGGGGGEERSAGSFPRSRPRFPSPGPGGCHRPDGAHGEGAARPRRGPSRGRAGGCSAPVASEPRVSPLSDIFLGRRLPCG